MSESGEFRSRWLSFQWGETYRDRGRHAYLDIGDSTAEAPRCRLQVRVVATPKRWMPPHDARVEVSISRNRWVRFDLSIGGARYIEPAP